jgi:two-component system response regulator YesN
MTPSAFSKRFSRTMGTTFKSYMTKLQLQQAQRDLLSTDKSITEIAADIGQTYPQYFHRFFKKHFGCTPQDYRKHNYDPYHYGIAKPPKARR